MGMALAQSQSQNKKVQNSSQKNLVLRTSESKKGNVNTSERNSNSTMIGQFARADELEGRKEQSTCKRKKKPIRKYEARAAKTFVCTPPMCCCPISRPPSSKWRDWGEGNNSEAKGNPNLIKLRANHCLHITQGILPPRMGYERCLRTLEESGESFGLSWQHHALIDPPPESHVGRND